MKHIVATLPQKDKHTNSSISFRKKRIYTPLIYKSHKYTFPYNTDGSISVLHTGTARNIFNPKNWHLWSHKIRQKHAANIRKTESKRNIYLNSEFFFNRRYNLWWGLACSEFLPRIIYVLLLSVTFSTNIYNYSNNNNLKINYNYKV